MAELDKNAMKYPYGDLDFIIDVYKVPLGEAIKFCYDIEEILEDDSNVKLFVDTDYKIKFSYIVSAGKLIDIRYCIFRLLDDYGADLLTFDFHEQFIK